MEMSVSHSSTPCTARTDAGPTEPVQRPSLVVPVRWSTAIVRGVLTMTGSGLSNQIGAGIGAHAFPVIGPADGVAVRQLVAAAVLFPVARPALHRFTWRQWWPVLLLGAATALMNIRLYVSIKRIGLGPAVTMEFLGPLAVALLAWRTWRDLLCGLSAGLGVFILLMPGPASDSTGVCCAGQASTGK